MPPRIFFFSAILGVLAALPAVAQTRIQQVRESRVMAEAVDFDPKSGQQVILTDDRGQETGRAKIRTLKDRRFIAVIVAGTAQVGGFVRAEGFGPGTTPVRFFWGGGVLGISNRITGRLPTGTEVQMSGAGAGAEAVLDWDLWSPSRLRFHLSYLPLAGTGSLASASCGGSTDCTVKLGFLATRMHGQYVTSGSRTKGFLGGGLGLYFPLSKDSNFLDKGQMGLTQAFEAAGGVEFTLPRNLRLDVGVQIAQFQSNEAVQIQQSGLFLSVLKPW